MPSTLHVTSGFEQVNCCVCVLTTTAARLGDTVMALQAKPVNRIHVRENRMLVIPEQSFIAASPKTVVRRTLGASATRPEVELRCGFASPQSAGLALVSRESGGSANGLTFAARYDRKLSG